MTLSRRASQLLYLIAVSPHFVVTVVPMALLHGRDGVRDTVAYHRPPEEIRGDATIAGAFLTLMLGIALTWIAIGVYRVVA